jgi:hypothetical protein
MGTGCFPGVKRPGRGADDNPNLAQRLKKSRVIPQRPLGRPRCRWEDNIEMDVQEVGGGGGDWMVLAQDRYRWRVLVSTVKNLRVP